MPTNCLSVFDHFVGLALKGSTALFSPVEKGWQGSNLELISIQDVLVPLEPQFMYINILKSKTKGVNQRKLWTNDWGWLFFKKRHNNMIQQTNEREAMSSKVK